MDCVWLQGPTFTVPTESFVNCVRYLLLEDMHLEVLVAGVDDGNLVILDLVASRSDPPSKVFPCGSPVLHVDAIGCLAVGGCADGTVHVWNFGAKVKVAMMPHTKAITALFLWEGPPDLANLESEEAALYVFSTAEDFMVKLWRVDVNDRTYTLHAVFASQYPLVRCVVLDSGEEGNAGVRVIGSVGKFMHCWNYEDATKKTYNWLSCRVYLREHLYVEKCLAEPGPWKIKEKHLTASDAREIGMCTNIADGDTEHTGHVIDVEYTHFKNVGRWPTKAFGVCVSPSLMWRAHDVGKIFALCRVAPGVLASGDEKGCTKVWRWSQTEGLYTPLHTISNAHSDIIKVILPLRCPDVFLTFGYDGKVKQWRLLHHDDNHQFLRLQRQIIIDAQFPVMCGDVFAPGLCVFSCLQFHREVQCWYLRPVASCALPDDMVFDGNMTVRVTLPASHEKLMDVAVPKESS